MPDITDLIGKIRLRGRRIAQTPRAFENWGQVLADMARERVGAGPEELTFRSRSGLTIQCPNRRGARVPIYEVFAEDSYRFETFLGPMSGGPIAALDIGGHIGTFACRLAQLSPQATVLSFEPSPVTAEYLRRNVATNGFDDRVQVFAKAVAGTTGRARFVDNGAASGLNGLVSANHTAPASDEVETISFDDAAALTGSGVDVVKIDCEGGEYDLVLQSSPWSWATVTRVVIEYHPVRGHGWPELEQFFAGTGLAVQRHDSFRGFGCVWLSRDPVALGHG